MIYLVTLDRELFENDTYKIIGVDESLSLLSTLQVVGLDTETSGLQPHTDKLLLVQLGCKDFQVVIDCTTIDIRLYKSYLESNRLFILWNAKFDLGFLYHKRIVPKRVYDGYLAEKLMYLGYPPGMHSLSLKSAGKHYLDIELDKSVRGKIIYSKLSDEIILYSANDVKYLEDIMNLQLEELKKKDLTTSIEYENRFVLVLAYTEYCGIKLDVDKWRSKMSNDTAEELKYKKLLDEWLIANEPNSPYIYVNTQGSLFDDFGEASQNPFDLTPKVSINWNSSKQLIPIFKKYGVDVTVDVKGRTNEIKDSIDAKVLKPQKDKCSLIPIYLKYREAVKVTSTYGENFLKQINTNSGRVHTHYNQLGADTTRITSGGKDKSKGVEYVNLLNLPADSVTRSCFVAEKGNKWISIDYSGQESFLMASIANDTAMINELTYGDKDLHTLTAKLVFKEIPKDATTKEVKEKYHNLRQQAKGYEF